MHHLQSQWLADAACTFSWAVNTQNSFLKVTLSEDEYLLTFANGVVGAIGRTDGSIRIVAGADCGSEALADLMENQLSPLAESLNGQLILHGSAVESRSDAIAFFGLSGRGKSTLATAFSATGYRFLTDDALRVNLGEVDATALPGAPAIRLNHDSAEALSPLLSKTFAIDQPDHKQRFIAAGSEHFCDQPKRLKAIYFLRNDQPSDLSISRASGFRVVTELVEHTFLLDAFSDASMRRHFQQMTTLAALVPIFSLDYPRQYDLLPSVVNAIVAHADSLD